VRTQIIGISAPVSSHHKGRIAIVTDAGRDAVDADVLLTSGTEADGQIVWSWRLDAGVKSVEFIPPATEARKPDLRGERV
jgi:hypothetical protein